MEPESLLDSIFRHRLSLDVANGWSACSAGCLALGRKHVLFLEGLGGLHRIAGEPWGFQVAAASTIVCWLTEDD